jgi:predicted permease
MTDFLHDVRYALRSMRKSPGFTAVALLTVALGIGANTAIFSIVDAVMLRPLPYRDPGSLVQIWERRRDNDHAVASYPNFRDWRAQSRLIAPMAAYSDWTLNLTGAGSPERVQGAVVSATFFQVLGVRADIGRTFAPDEDTPGHDDVVIVGHGLFERRFGSDRSLVGRPIMLNGKSFTVIGVAPTGIRLPNLPPEADFFLPVSHGYFTEAENRDGHYLSVVGRLKKGATLAMARSELGAIAHRLLVLYPHSNTGVSSFPLSREIAGDTRPALLVLLAAVFVVLMIAAVNVANMLLARASARRREIAVRAALGAGRLRLVRQFLTESILLAAAGGGLGILLALGSVAFVRNFGPADIPRLDQARVDGPVLLYALAVSVVTGILFGLAPACHGSGNRLNESLKQGDRRSSSGDSGARRAFVVAEFTLSLMLLIGAGLMLQSFRRLTRLDPGFRTTGILTAELDFPESKYPRGRDITAFGARLLGRLRALPGVEAAGAVSNLPLRDDRRTTLSFVVEGRTPDRANPMIAIFSSVTPGYFDAIGVPLFRGRLFADSDAREAPKVAIINRSFAERIFPGGDPLGKRVALSDNPGPGDWATVVGIVADARSQDIQTEPGIQLFMPYSQRASSGMAIVVRTAGDPARLSTDLRRAVSEIDPEQPTYAIATMRSVVSDSMGQPRFRALLIGIFAGIALLLAAAGIYGVLSYTVMQRTHEIGIRVALGAERGHVLRLIVGHGMRLAAIGVGIGLLGGLAVSRFLKAVLFGVETTDLATFAAVPGILLLVALAACAIPGWRATRVDPVVALREE